MTLACALDISVRLGSFNFRYRSALVVWDTTTIILKERSDQTASSPHGDPRCHFLEVERLGQHLVRQAGAPGEPRCANSRACWARSALRQWTRDGRWQLCEPLRHLHTPAPVLWCQLLTNFYPVWMDVQVFAQDRVQWGLLQSETLGPVTYRPLQTIQDGLLHLSEGILLADRANSAAALFPAK